MTYSATKFEVATSNGLGEDTFKRNVADGQTPGKTDDDGLTLVQIKKIASIMNGTISLS